MTDSASSCDEFIPTSLQSQYHKYTCTFSYFYPQYNIQKLSWRRGILIWQFHITDILFPLLLSFDQVRGGGLLVSMGSSLLLVGEGEISVNWVSQNTEHEKRSIDWGSSRFNNTMSTMAWDAHLPITILEVNVQLLTAPYQLWNAQKK